MLINISDLNLFLTNLAVLTLSSLLLNYSISMMKIANIQQDLTSVEQLTANDLLTIKGGKANDDKRRMRPGGGTTTSSPCKSDRDRD